MVSELGPTRTSGFSVEVGCDGCIFETTQKSRRSRASVIHLRRRYWTSPGRPALASPTIPPRIPIPLVRRRSPRFGGRRRNPPTAPFFFGAKCPSDRAGAGQNLVYGPPRCGVPRRTSGLSGRQCWLRYPAGCKSRGHEQSASPTKTVASPECDEVNQVPTFDQSHLQPHPY